MPDEKDAKHVRPFAEWLQAQRGGALHLELGEKLHELTEAVQLHGKGGTLTLTVKLKPATKGRADGMLVVSDDVAVKKPVGDRPEALFFIDRTGNLTRHDPNQQELPLRAVDATDNKAEEVAG
jgi:hypothetical protein